MNRFLDRAGAALLLTAYVAIVVHHSFSRREFFDTVGYTLPAANLVLRGQLSVPQLGPQLGLDRFWLLNAPWIAVGPAPLMALLGPGRIPNCLGLIGLGLLNAAVFVPAIRRVSGTTSWSLAVLASLAFLLHRLVLTEYANHRYTAIVPGLMLLAFWPMRDPGRPRPWWQGLIAGSLPLVHPSLGPAWLLWAAGSLGEAVQTRRSGQPAPWPRAAWCAFLAATLASIAWYARPEPFQTQFLPHLRFGNYRANIRFAGLIAAFASPIAAIPTWSVNAFALALSAATVAVAIVKPAARARLAPALVPAITILAILPLDGRKGFNYYDYYIAGLGPCLLLALPEGRPRRVAVALVAVLGAAALAVALRIDRGLPDLTTTAQGRAFVMEHSRPGDRLVLGPPFILVAAPPSLPEGRTAPRVVPMDYYLDPFDRATFVREIDGLCDVYIGEEEWYYRPIWTDMVRGEPLFRDAEITAVEFRGQGVIVARKKAARAPSEER